MRTTKSITISLTPNQRRLAERLAIKHNRSMSELFVEGLHLMEQQPEPELLRQAFEDAVTPHLAEVVRILEEQAQPASEERRMTAAEIDAEIALARRTTKPARKAIPKSSRR
jgi:hypothetical protein